MRWGALWGGIVLWARLAHAVTPFLGLEYGSTERENTNLNVLDAWARGVAGQVVEVFNVQAPEFGARCHATEDQWTAIMRAVQAARNAGGGTVYFPACGQDLSYRIAQPLALDDDLYYLTFAGSPTAGASLLQPTSSFVGDALVHVGTTTLNERIAFHGMSFSGRMPGGTDLTVPLLWLQHVAQATVTHSHFLQSNSTTGALSLTGSSCQVMEISSNVFGSTTQVGLYVDQCGDLRIAGNHFIEGRVGGGAGQRALHLNRSAVPGKIEIVGNEFSSWEGDWALDIGGVSGAADTATITGNQFADLKGGIRIQEAGVVVAANVFSTPRASANAAISVTNDGATIAANRIEWEDGVGIGLSGTSGSVTGNTIEGATTGIDCNGCTGFVIAGNRVLDGGATTTYGILERNGADANLIGPNEVTAGSTAKWTIIGAATQVWEPTTAEVASVVAGSFRGAPPTTQTIAAADIITANACGGVKRIDAAGTVTTNTTNTFTAPAAGNAGCVMDVCTTGANNITLDNNANFHTWGERDIVLRPNTCVRVASDGVTWRQIGFQSDPLGSVEFGGTGTVPAASGLARFPNNVVMLTARNAANSLDLSVISTTASNAIQVGDSNVAVARFVPSLAPPNTDAPQTCAVLLNGATYFDLSLNRLCYCADLGGGFTWNRVFDNTVGTSTSCG